MRRFHGAHAGSERAAGRLRGVGEVLAARKELGVLRHHVVSCTALRALTLPNPILRVVRL